MIGGLVPTLGIVSKAKQLYNVSRPNASAYTGAALWAGACFKIEAGVLPARFVEFPNSRR
jgi:hypothetical protein